MNRKLREITAQEKFLSHSPYKRVVMDLLNLILDKSTPFYEWYWTSIESQYKQPSPEKMSAFFSPEDYQLLQDLYGHLLPGFSSLKYFILQKFGNESFSEEEKKDNINIDQKVTIAIPFHLIFESF